MWITPRPQYNTTPLWEVLVHNSFFQILKLNSNSSFFGRLASIAVHASDKHPLTYRIIYLSKSSPMVIAVSQSLDIIKSHWKILDDEFIPKLIDQESDVRDQYMESKITGMASSEHEEEGDQNDEKSLSEFKEHFAINEKLLTYFTCTLWQSSLKPPSGKMFITQQTICYYTAHPTLHLLIPFQRITSINKESALGFLPSSIKITACIGPDEKKESQFLFHFLSRDQAYDILEQLWKLSMEELSLANELYEKEQYSDSNSGTDSPNNNNNNNSSSLSPSLRPTTKQILDTEKTNRNYQKLFKLPPDEELVQVHVGWIIRSKRFLGDLFISPNFFCVRVKETFSSKVYSTVLHISKIDSIEKVKPFLGFSLLTDTLKIKTTSGREIQFQLFHCDEALETMQKYWQITSKNILRSPNTLHIESIGVGWFSQEPDLKEEDPDELKYKLEHWEKYYRKNGSDSTMSITKKLRHLLRIGVPDPYRGHVWAFCSGACYMWEKENGYYENILKNNANNTSLAVEEIEKDVRRTFAHHPYFKHDDGVNALRRVLTAYSWRNPVIGYCQSMNVVAGTMLLYMQEEAAFWVLCRVCEFLLCDYYVEQMIGSIIDQKIFADLVKSYVPDVYLHLEKVGLPINILSLPWFMCLFVSYIPFSVATRVIDCFLLEGTNVLFQTGLAILKINKNDILVEKDSEVIVELLRNKVYNIDELIQVTFNDFDIPEESINELRNAHKFKEIKKNRPKS
eukprot:gene10393-12764_t